MDKGSGKSSFAVGVALSPVPYIAAVLMLATLKGRADVTLRGGGLGDLPARVGPVAADGPLDLLAVSELAIASGTPRSSPDGAGARSYCHHERSSASRPALMSGCACRRRGRRSPFARIARTTFAGVARRARRAPVLARVPNVASSRAAAAPPAIAWPVSDMGSHVGGVGRSGSYPREHEGKCRPEARSCPARRQKRAWALAGFVLAIGSTEVSGEPGRASGSTKLEPSRRRVTPAP
jgi:hypothetical protein